jgi:hypothetical protein
VPAVTEARFWELIAEHVEVDDAFQVDVSGLQDALAALAPEEITAFDRVFYKLYCSSYTWALWGAAYVINGGCSDDGFDYFRGWLIAQGREVFEAAVKAPDSLAEHSSEDVECEDMLYVASRAYEAATGKEAPNTPYSYPDLGDGWDFDDKAEMKRRYPRLFARYWET